MSTRALATAAVIAAAASLSYAVVAVATHDNPVCAIPTPGVSCTDGANRQTAGGNGKVSHVGWPKIDGVLRMGDAHGRLIVGGPDNDELLGLGGSDHIIGKGGNDVLWGDQLVVGNGPHQTDVVSGGPGDDWLYPSHGTNVLNAGPGDDHVIAYYGHGTIDCGTGNDIAQVRMNGAYTLHNCETIKHFCAFGSLPNGDCKQPGQRALVVRRR